MPYLLGFILLTIVSLYYSSYVYIVIALSIGLYPLNFHTSLRVYSPLTVLPCLSGFILLTSDKKAKKKSKKNVLPCLSGFILLTPTLKSRINNYFLMQFAWQKIIHSQPPSLHHQNHLLTTILPYAWQNAKILFNLPPFLSSDFHYRFLILHKSAQSLFLTSTSYNPDKILITKTALRHLSVLYHLSSILSFLLIKILVSIYLLP